MNTALLAELKQESVNTKRLLECLPSDNLDWTPHEKSMKIGKLAKHIAELPVWIGRIINADEFDFASANWNSESKETKEDILKLFDEKLAEALSVLETASDETLNKKWLVRRGEQIMFELSKKIALRNFTYNHTYHHRGQLSVYLRLLDIPVPGMYGPSADEKMF
ncbi:MAG: DinB family protein [Parafilimonas sp.]